MKDGKMIGSILALMLLMTTGCAVSSSGDMPDSRAAASKSSSNETPDLGSAESGTEEINLVNANNQFGFDLFGQLRKSNGDKNLFFSPLSITIALAMTYNGAAGETEKEVAHILKLRGMSLGRVNQKTSDLLTSLKSVDPKIELSIANSIWARKGVQFREDFLERNRGFFGAKITSLDFDDPLAPTKINGWIHTSTKGKIAQIIEEINRQEMMLLINAIYFKGTWQQVFDKKHTREKPFHLLDGGTKLIPMMSQSGSYRYLQGENFQ
jgi:serine protease inhibitor